MTLCHLDHPMYMLGYLPKEDRVYLMDKSQGIHRYYNHIYSVTLSLVVLYFVRDIILGQGDLSNVHKRVFRGLMPLFMHMHTSP
jgi:hypothetical protein